MNSDSYSAAGLTYYFRLDDQINPNKIQDSRSINSFIADIQSYTPIVAFAKEASLIIC